MAYIVTLGVVGECQTNRIGLASAKHGQTQTKNHKKVCDISDRGRSNQPVRTGRNSADLEGLIQKEKEKSG